MYEITRRFTTPTGQEIDIYETFSPLPPQLQQRNITSTTRTDMLKTTSADGYCIELTLKMGVAGEYDVISRQNAALGNL